MSLTRSTLALPLSFTLRTKDSSNPVVGSVNVRKAWCGRFAVTPSTVVRSNFSESVAPNDTDLPNGVEGLSLRMVSTDKSIYIPCDVKLTCLWNLRQHQHLCSLRTQPHLQSSTRKRRTQLRRQKVEVKRQSCLGPSSWLI